MDSPCVSVWLGGALAAYAFGEGCPFGPDRMEAFRKRLYAMGLRRQVRLRVPERAGRLQSRQSGPGLDRRGGCPTGRNALIPV